MNKESLFTGALMPYQQDVLNKLKHSDAVLVYHGLGAGKTATSIAATEGYDTDVVVPASLRGNYAKEVKKFTVGGSGRDVMSYQKFSKGLPSTKNMLVLDEPQKIGRASSKMSQAVVRGAKRYDKRILLSGTPASNSPSELAPIIRTLSPYSDIPLNPMEFNKKFLGEREAHLGIIQRLRGIHPGVEYYPKNTEKIREAIKGKVSYYAPPKENYPERINVVRKVPASKEQRQYYNYVTDKANPIIAMKVRHNLPLSKQESKQMNAFMTAARQVSNTTRPYGGREVMSPKIKSVVDDFSASYKKNPQHKGVIYSNYLAGGLNEVSDELAKRGISNEKFTGELSDAQRKAAVENYNIGKTKALLISSSGAEGLDLKNTRSIQIMEPHWNRARLEQVIGRGVRYKSHEALSPEQRNVTVTKYQTVLPKTFTQKLFHRKADTSTDEYLENMSDRKQETLDKFLDIFKEEGTIKKSSLADPKREETSMKKEAYQYGFVKELEKIAVGKNSVKDVMKYIERHPLSLGAGVGAGVGVIPSDTPIAVNPYGLTMGTRKPTAEERDKSYLTRLPKRMLAGALTGAFLGGTGHKIVKELTRKEKTGLKKVLENLSN